MKFFTSCPLIISFINLASTIGDAFASPHGPSNGISPNVHSHARFHEAHHLFKREEFRCTPSQTCGNGACCGESGWCGYGPVYCGAGCTSNCDAKAPCGQYAEKPGQKCPLNTCCSEFGFCGTSSEFCNDKCQNNCELHPKPSGSKGNGVLSRIIGYYESWSQRSKCHKMNPSDLPLDALTHLNYAFAYIDPQSFQLTTMDDTTPEMLFDEVAQLKKLKSDLQVWISIGGWTFSDNGTSTQPVFGNIARTEANRRKFAENLLTFVKYYGYDGVDLDWEYPGAPDRGGKEDDTTNFVLLMKTIRSVFNTSGRKLGLTFTAPSSYWYLRWFDLPGLIKYVDWINLMTYDLHGTWDSTNPIGNIVQGHTNLTEIEQALELFWRVDIPPSKVYMGFGFYGRSFQLTDPSCSTPGCRFKGGANPGPCSDTSGILMYYEIMALLKKNPDLKPVWDKKAGVKYLVFNKDQWVSYDDADTFKQKVEWANKIGLGGSLIWASDADDDKYSAHSGLIGKTVKHPDLSSLAKPFPTNQAAVTQNLIRQTGQSCRKADDCIKEDDPHKVAFACESSEILTGFAKERCGSGQSRAICCSRQTKPDSCRWRGSASECNGQCHPGEIMVLQSSWGGSPREKGSDTRKCGRGAKAYCCDAPEYTKLSDKCRWVDARRGEDSCKSDETEVARGGSSGQRYCCKKPAPFVDCVWKGKTPDCADAKCNAQEVAVALNPWGDKYKQLERESCAWGRKKVLCCQVQVPPPRKPLQCTSNICDINKGLCGPDYDDSDLSATVDKRTDIFDSLSENGYAVLGERGNKQVAVELKEIIYRWKLRGYPSRGEFYKTNWSRGLLSHNYYRLERGSCPAFRIVVEKLKIDKDKRPEDKDIPKDFEVEHPEDAASTIGWELRILSTGLYPDGSRTGLLPIPDFAFEALGEPVLPSNLPLVSNRSPRLRIPIERLSEASGSRTNPTILVGASRPINRAKNNVFQLQDTMERVRFEGLALTAARGDIESQQQLARQFDVTLGVFNYCREPEIARFRQSSFQARIQQWPHIERELPLFQGSFNVLRRAGNLRQRAVERRAYNTLYGWIVEATTQLALSISVGGISRENADAWSDLLNEYENRLEDIRLERFNEDFGEVD